MNMVILCLANCVVAQCTEAGWIRTYGSDGYEMAYSLDRFSNGDLLVGGESDSEGAGSTDWLFMRITQTGEIVWTSLHGTNWLESGKDVIVKVLDDDSFLFAGYRHPVGATARHTVIGKIDSQGNPLWNKELLADPNGDTPRNIFISSAGRIYILGTTNSYGAGSSDGFVAEVTADGNILWTTSLGSTNNDHFVEAAEKSNGNIILIGNTQSWDNVTHHPWIVQMTPDGEFVTELVYHHSAQEIFSSIVIDEQNNMFITGWSRSFGNGTKDMFVLKMNTQFEIDWQMNFAGDSDDSPSHIHLHDDRLIISALSSSYGPTGDNLLLLCSDLDGNLDWSNTYFDDVGSSPGFFAQNIVSEGPGSLIVTGNMDDNEGDIFLIKLNECGETGCETSQELATSSGQFNMDVVNYSTNDLGLFATMTPEVSSLATVEAMPCEAQCQITCSFSIPDGCKDENLDLLHNSSWEGTDEVNFEWDFGNGTYSDEISPELMYTEPGDYTILLVANDPMGVCSDSISHTVSIGESPVLVGLEGFHICGSDQHEVHAECLNTDCYFQWPGIGAGPIMQINQPGYYHVIGSNTCGSDTIGFEVTHTPDPWNSSAEYFDLCNNPVVEVELPIEYEVHHDGIIINELYIDTPGDYWLTAVHNECSFNMMVQVVDAPEISLWTESPEDCYPHEDISFFYGCEDCDDVNILTHQSLGNGETLYVVEASNDCASKQDSLIVQHVCPTCELYIPNSFTPNHDGTNDFFKPVMSCEPLEYEFVIYNRWGEMIWYTEDFDEGWMGDSKGGSHYVQDGVYGWKLRAIFLDPDILTKEVSGTLTIIR